MIPGYALHVGGYIIDTALNGRKVVDKIFDRYERIGDSKNFDGLRLGLYISKLVVESRGERTKVESIQEVGIKFLIKLPVGSYKTSQPIGDLSDIECVVDGFSFFN